MASVTYKTKKKTFLSLELLKVCVLLQFRQSKKKIYYIFAGMSLPCISREDITKLILFARKKNIFLHVDFQFDMPRSEFSLKISSSKYWLCFHLFCGGHRNVFPL